MPTYVLIIDLVGLTLAFAGLNLAFRQTQVRDWWSRLRGASVRPAYSGDGDDPAAYAMRIGGVMIAVFGLVISIMFTVVATAH